MNKAYWNDLADRFDASVFDIAANETSGNLGERIRTLGETHQTAGDFGCGTGATTALLSSHFDRVVAVDFAEKLYALAVGVLASGALNNWLTLVDDLQSPQSERDTRLRL